MNKDTFKHMSHFPYVLFYTSCAINYSVSLIIVATFSQEELYLFFYLFIK